MKRPHRRLHLLIWVLLAPATAIVGFIAWTMRPQAPFADLPGVVEAPGAPEETP